MVHRGFHIQKKQKRTDLNVYNLLITTKVSEKRIKINSKVTF